MFPETVAIEELTVVQKRDLRIIKPTLLTKHPFMSILAVLIFYYISTLLSSYLFELILAPIWTDPWIGPYWIEIVPLNILMIIFYNLISLILFFVIIPKIIGVSYKKQEITQFLKKIKARWLKSLIKYFLFGLILAVIVLFFLFSTNLSFILSIYLPIWWRVEYFSLTLYSSEIVWQELVFRGIILTILLETKSKKKTILLNSLIQSVFSFMVLVISINTPFTQFLPSLVFLFIANTFMNAFLAYLRIKTNSIIPGIFVQIVIYILAVPISLSWFAAIFY
jgi:hypothetical protein